MVLIASPTKIGRDAIYELVITDIAVAFLLEDHIPYIEICKASNNVSMRSSKNTHYIRSAKLTTVYTRAYQKVDAETNISGVAFSVMAKSMPARSIQRLHRFSGHRQPEKTVVAPQLPAVGCKR
ncbi:MAG: hypothetical protein R2792_06795 [Saprospiraceae bacterium]